MTAVLLVALGAAVGAPLRYLLDRAVQARTGGVFPWGTFTVNVLGSFALGLVVGSAPGSATVTVLGVGFCGAFTTYSTFGFETVRLIEDGRARLASANVALSTITGLGAAIGGYALGVAIA